MHGNAGDLQRAPLDRAVARARWRRDRKQQQRQQKGRWSEMPTPNLHELADVRGRFILRSNDLGHLHFQVRRHFGKHIFKQPAHRRRTNLLDFSER